MKMPETSLLQTVMAYLLRDEGGFINRKDDHGGPTKWGITLDDLTEWRKVDNLTIQDLENMPLTEAEDIYYTHYLKPLGCEQMKSSGVAVCLADTGILYGVVTTIHFAQKVCNGFGYSLTVDGLAGPATIQAINKCNPTLFIKDFHGLILARIDYIVAQDPSQKVFYDGWLARADRLLGLA
jgi:lysozyme family protein